MVCQICCFHPAKGRLGMSSAKIRQHTLHLNFLEQMCLQQDGNGELWKDTCQSFPSLESVNTDKEEAHQHPWAKCSFYWECQNALHYLLLKNDGLADTRVLSLRALHQGGGGLQKMVQLMRSALQNRSFTLFALGHLSWNASIMTDVASGPHQKNVHSEAGNFAQGHLLLWFRSPLNMPSFTAVLCACCGNWLKATTCWTKSSLS